MAKWTDNINGEPYTSRGVRTVRRRVLGNTTIVIWQGAGYLAYIIANRINYNGKNTAEHFKNYARTGKFCRRMEQELSLVPTRDMQINRALGQQIHLADKAHMKLKSIIDRLMPQVSSIQELKEHLLRHGYKTYMGRGIAFFHLHSKVKVKGSDIGRDYSLGLLENRIGFNATTTQNPELKKRKRKRRGLGLHL